jgi:predicted MPP superfamily phosphohydrolase
MGFCFDCVEAESIIVEGVDMYDKPPPKVEGLSQTMSNLQHILKKYVKISNDE